MHHERPSTTAAMVALGVLALHARGDPYAPLNDPEARMLTTGLRAAGPLVSLASRLAPHPALARAAEWLIAPGMSRHFGARKQRIELLARGAIDSGIARVVVLAAGFDLLAHRLSLSGPSLHLIELDHPATQRIKHRMYAEDPSAARITLIPADLADPAWPAHLAPHLQPVLPTLFVLEGLSMYLTQEQWGTLLDTLAHLPGAARLLFTFLGTDARGRARLARQRPYLPFILNLLSEPFRWGSRPEDIPAFTARLAWRTDRILGPESLTKPFAGEYIASCSR